MLLSLIQKQVVRQIPEKVSEMIKFMNHVTAPQEHESCENSAYSRERSNYD